ARRLVALHAPPRAARGRRARPARRRVVVRRPARGPGRRPRGGRLRPAPVRGRPALPLDRPGARRPGHRGGGRAERAAHLLHGRHRRRRVEDRRRGAHLAERLRRLLRRGVDRRDRRGALGPARRLRGHGLRGAAQQRLGGARHLPERRRGEDVEPRRAARRGADRRRARAPPEPRRGLRRRTRQPVRAEPRARRLPHARRRAELAAGALRLRQHRRGGRGDGARQPERALRLDVARRAQAVDDHQRRARGGRVQEHRRRRPVDEARRRAAERAGGQEQRRRHRRAPATRLRAGGGQAGRGALPLRGRGRDVDAGERRPAAHHAPVLLHDDHRRPGEPRRGVRGHRGLLQVHRRRPDVGDAPDAARRQPRPLDQPARSGDHDPVERRRRERHARRRAQLEHAVQPAHGRDLPGGRGRPVPVPRLRRAAGQLDAHRAEPPARRGRARRPDPALAAGPRVRDRPDHPAPGEPRHGVRLVQGAVQPHGAEHRAGAAVLGGGGVAVRAAGQGPHLPLPARGADGGVAARRGDAVLRIAVPAPHARRGGHLGAHLPRPHGQRPEVPVARGRHPDHDRRHRGGVLQHALRGGGEPARARGDLDGGQRRAGARHARRREDVDERHPQGAPARRARADGRAVAAPARQRLRDGAALPARRLPAVRVQDHRLREELDAPHDRGERRAGRPPGARGARGPGPRGAALPGHRVRHVRLVRRRRAVAAAAAQPPRHAGHRHQGAPGRPRALHAGARLLGARRPRAAARAERAGDRRAAPPLRAARGVPRALRERVRRRGERAPGVGRPGVPAAGRDDRLLARRRARRGRRAGDARRARRGRAGGALLHERGRGRAEPAAGRAVDARAVDGARGDAGAPRARGAQPVRLEPRARGAVGRERGALRAQRPDGRAGHLHAPPHGRRADRHAPAPGARRPARGARRHHAGGAHGAARAQPARARPRERGEPGGGPAARGQDAPHERRPGRRQHARPPHDDRGAPRHAPGALQPARAAGAHRLPVRPHDARRPARGARRRRPVPRAALGARPRGHAARRGARRGGADGGAV
ncbi:MAG: GH74 / GH33, partial [uncultured Gemmatimonadaceae bacterium]